MNDWVNLEQYPDPTAGEAMDRVLYGGADPLPADDAGIRRLAKAVTLQAARDYAAALRLPAEKEKTARERAELEAFFRSGFFRRLSGMNGEFVIRRIREEVRKG